MKKRKIICLIISIVMAFGLITGCISEDDSGTPATTTNAREVVTGDALVNPDTTPAVVDDEEILSLMEEEGLELVNGLFRFKDTRSITVELFDRGLEDGRTEPLDSYWTKWIQKKVLEDHNIAVSYRLVPRWSEDTEISNILASGDAPDIMYTYNYPAIQTYAEDMNGILDMSYFVDDYAFLCQNLWDLLGPSLIYYNRDPVTGHIWAIEGIRSMNTRINTFVRKDWLAKLNINEPTTLEEFEAMLYDFQSNAQTLLGAEAGKIVPLTLGSDVIWRADHMLASFIPNAITDKEIYTLGFDDRHFLFPGMKEGIRKLNSWYNAGLIWPDFGLYTTGDSTEDDMIKSGVVGSMIHNWNYPYRDLENGIEVTLKRTVGDEAGFIPVASFLDDAGTYKKFMPSNNDRKICFPSTNKEPVASLIYLDFVSRLDIRAYLGAGEEGINFQMLEGGIAEVLTPTDISARDNIFTAEFADDTGKNQWTYGELIMNSPQNIDYLLTFNSDGNIFLKDPEATLKSVGFSYPSTTPDVIARAVEYTELDARVKRDISVGSIEAEKGMSRSLPAKRDTVLVKAVTESEANFDSVWDSGFQDYLTSGGQAIIDERTEKWIQFFGDVDNLG